MCRRITFRSALMSILIFCALTAGGCETEGKVSPPLQTVPYVDLDRYTGVWYEIARYPNSFQEGCVGSKATYSLKDNGEISVLNECHERSFDGKLRTAKGKARVVDKESNAKLRVSFFWPFSGDYWIIEIGENYEYAVVGHPKIKYLWVLGRTREMDMKTFENILSRLREKKYDTSRLIRTQQKMHDGHTSPCHDVYMACFFPGGRYKSGNAVF